MAVQFGLADWVRIMAGLQTPITSMSAGRCRIEGDGLLALRLEAMFTGWLRTARAGLRPSAAVRPRTPAARLPRRG